MNINSGFSDGLNAILAGGPEPLHYVTGKQFHRAQRFDKSKITSGPKRNRRVRWATAERKMLGDGAMPSGVKWCSAR